MKEYLNEAKDRFYLSLGGREFSPVIQASTAIALDYSQEIHQKGNSAPMVITFPCKENTALWMAVQFLINEFFHDYVHQSENRIKELGLKAGDKIDIFSTTALFQRIDNDKNKLVMKFSDGAIAYADIQNIQFVNPGRKKMVNKYVNYHKNKKKFLDQRKALTQILSLDHNPNFGALSSKVVLISGRGKSGLFRRQLRETLVYDEPLSETVLLDKCLLISPDFSCFSGSVDAKSGRNTEFFVKAVKQSLDTSEYKDSKIETIVNDCLRLIEQSLKTKKFVDSFQSLYSALLKHSDYQILGSKLQNLMKYHPGIEDDLINDVSAVFVNDLHLVLENPKTVTYLTKHKIPVFIISDRVISDWKELEIYKTVFSTEAFVDVYRFNWDKNKIVELELQYDNGYNFVDHYNNNAFCRFISQKITIEQVVPSEFDQIFNALESKSFLSSLGEYELLQKAYYQILRPLLYTLKNSIEQPDTIKLIAHFNHFTEILDSSSSGLNEEIKTSINESLHSLKSYILSGEQPKGFIDDRKYLFYQDISIDTMNFMLPAESDLKVMVHHNDISPTAKSIKFIGYPFREYSFKYIDQSIFKKVIPNVNFVLNPCESSVTMNSLKRKIGSGYYVEKFPSCLNELEKYRIKDDVQIESIIDGSINFEESGNPYHEFENATTTEYEEFEQMLNELRYSGYKGSNDVEEISGQYLLNCNVLHFENGSYVFLPQNWRILTLKESITGSIESYSSKITDVAVGDIAVIVNVSRKSITKYLEGSKSMLTYMETLESWREILRQERNKHEYVYQFVERLEKVNCSMQIGGSPENYNVLRWLHDETMLAPAYENLKMILGLKYPKEELSERAKAILGAKTIILKAKNKLDRAVKDKLADMIGSSHDVLDDTFTIQVQGIEVKGKKNEIVGIEKRNDLKIEYHSTMKFLK
ncbi:hypothetical protein [Flagellimonas sediminis]|uniref:Uncharacterized protein n=1 Tax=Flagellimonas sediminis TaxID=2696468 RepID=A0A6I5KSX9_9FLAO|nr:hypothetical protein [Allomuricauda sediminis]NDV43085.1 hypothetical protein [Allomuricauda sediminis]